MSSTDENSNCWTCGHTSFTTQHCRPHQIRSERFSGNLPHRRTKIHRHTACTITRSGPEPEVIYVATVLTDVGPVEIEVPRDRNGEFVPRIVPRNARWLSGFDEQVLALYARGMMVRDIQFCLAKMYGTDVSPDLISKVTDAVNDEITAWQSRPLDSLWPVVYIDVLWIKVRDGRIANRPVYLAVGVDLDGCKHVLGLWIGKDGEGARQWLTILGELKACGIEDVLVACCDGLPGLPDAINAFWPRTTVQTCVIHLVRASLRYASKADHGKLVSALRRVYTAVSEQAAEQALDEFTTSDLGRKYPAVVRTWSQACKDFVPYLAFPPEIRKVIYSTNMIESINARLRKVTRSRGQIPDRAGRGQGALPGHPRADRAQDPQQDARRAALEDRAERVLDLLPGPYYPQLNPQNLHGITDTP
ncbi:IS256 family transposase [Streptomyces netropsis]|uniref:IS256 family transposase n=1 Tax=Streptomyces netropsis TaxID=55404 RepID=UPI003791F519